MCLASLPCSLAVLESSGSHLVTIVSTGSSVRPGHSCPRACPEGREVEELSLQRVYRTQVSDGSRVHIPLLGTVLRSKCAPRTPCTAVTGRRGQWRRGW